MVSNSRNKVYQTWEQPCREALYSRLIPLHFGTRAVTDSPTMSQYQITKPTSNFPGLALSRPLPLPPHASAHSSLSRLKISIIKATEHEKSAEAQKMSVEEKKEFCSLYQKNAASSCQFNTILGATWHDFPPRIFFCLPRFFYAPLLF